MAHLLFLLLLAKRNLANDAVSGEFGVKEAGLWHCLWSAPARLAFKTITICARQVQVAGLVGRA